MFNVFRLAFTICVVVVFTIIMAPLQLLAIRMRWRLARRIPTLWHRLALELLGVRVKVRGEIPSSRPLLIVANHLSWSDILVLGSVLDVCFIAKAEVKSWPGINVLALFQRTVFIDRDRRYQTRAHAGQIAQRLVEGDAMVLFAEGTTGSGHKLLPFRSALFGAIHAALDNSPATHVTVQPVAIAYTKLHGLPLGRVDQGMAAWPGDVELVPHLLSFLMNGAYDAEVVFGKPEDFDAETKRKAIAVHMEAEVRKGFVSAMRMHPPDGG